MPSSCCRPRGCRASILSHRLTALPGRAGLPAALTWLALIGFATLPARCFAADKFTLDESPAAAGQWGYRPEAEAVSDVDPPSFSWRPQSDAAVWEIECRRGDESGEIVYAAEAIEMNVHRPPETFGAGEYSWRYRAVDREGRRSDWSRSRRFAIAEDAVSLPLAPREQLLARIPTEHPRLFLRPDDLPRLRELAGGKLRDAFARLEARCERLVAKPPPTDEPPKYGPDVEFKSEEWRKIWWGNRTYTIAALDGAATLAFTRLINGNEEYGRLAKRILLECAEWDPLGATGYRYNDEAGMPYAYHFARTYTFLHDLLDEVERERCREVLRVRGNEMYKHLYPRHLWRPYSSHSNRAWHFLGELGIAMHGELPEADDWVWFAVNVFHNVYPVWSDSDGGWHEGFSYWSSYLSRFTWWADVMLSALDIDAYEMPFFSQMGYYAMYLLPPNKVGAGFGDLNAPKEASNARSLMSQIARQAGNGHWQWYVDQLGGTPQPSDYVGFLRAAAEPVEPVPPTDLPTSRLFEGTGLAIFNTSLSDADESVQVQFKSSPFGTQSHGYEANNSFLLWAYGQRLLIRSGYRDIYGSDHHQKWMWSTRSVNNITVDGVGQLKHSPLAEGEIVDFVSTDDVDIVVGEAGDSYRPDAKADSVLDRFTRAMVFVKPDCLFVFDILQAKSPSTFEYHLHSPVKFDVKGSREAVLQSEDVRCDLRFLVPQDLQFSQTDQYDPNPRPRVTMREWHLTGRASQSSRSGEFLTFIRPYRDQDAEPPQVEAETLDGGYRIRLATDGRRVTMLLPTGSQVLAADDLKADSEIAVRVETADGAVETVHARLE